MSWLRLRMKIQAITAIKIAITAMPPTTPPTMAPIGLELEGEDVEVEV
jgi:hypothetical protein